MPRKATKPKRGFLEGYRTYDPAVEGYGNSTEWRQTFNARMGFDEAAERMRGNDPRGILGVSAQATWSEIVKAFRKLSMEYHPDRIAYTGLTQADATEKFKKLTAAYTLLEKEYGIR